MAASKDTQALFMEGLNAIKEYAKVNGNVVSKDDVDGYFRGIELDDAKRNMIYGYLMANNIKVSGEDTLDNDFIAMMEQTAESNGTDAVQMLTEEDYAKDEEYVRMYLDDLSRMERMSDTSRAYLLMNIVEDNDEESLELLSQSFLEPIIGWIEPYRNKGVLSSDLIQEANLAMMGYIKQKRFANHEDWKKKIKEGSTEDLLGVLEGVTDEVKSEVAGSLSMMIDEQHSSDRVTGKVLSKVNLVNDWAARLKEELGRKPDINEVAEKMGVSADVVKDAIRLSGEKIEDISGENV